MASDGDVPLLDDMGPLLKQLVSLHARQSAAKVKVTTASAPPSSQVASAAAATAAQQPGSQPSASTKAVAACTATVQRDSSDAGKVTGSTGGGSCTAGCLTSPSSAAQAAADRKQANFAGLKKGFLFEDGSEASKKNRLPGAAAAAAAAGSASGGSGSGSCAQPAAGAKGCANHGDDVLPYVQASKAAHEKRFEIPEVQAAMKANETLLKNKDQWLTEELFQKIQKNEKLTRQICDPKFAQAITEFQTNPQAAMIRYHNNPEVQDFFKSFCGILGEHFSQLTDKPGAAAQQQPQLVLPAHGGSAHSFRSGAAAAASSGLLAEFAMAPVSAGTASAGGTWTSPALARPQSLTPASVGVGGSGGGTQQRHGMPPPLAARVPLAAASGEASSAAAAAAAAEEEERRAQEVLANNEIKRILLDPAILELFQSLKHNPERAQKLLQQGGAQFQANVRKLVDAGLLAFQR